MDEKKTSLWRRLASAIWWFRLPVVPFVLYAFLFVLIEVILFQCCIWLGLIGRPDAQRHGFVFSVGEQLGSVLSAVLAMWIVFRFFDRRTMRQSGFDMKKAGSDLIVGFLLGTLLVAAMVSVPAISGVYKFAGFSQHFNPLPMLSIFFLAALTEEVVFRAFVFQAAEKRMGTAWAFALACTLFGLVHMINDVPGATMQEKLWGCVCLIAEAGIVLNAAFLVRRTLWLPLGLHWAWNFFEGPIFGMTISGTSLPTQLVVVQLVGTPLFTGGAFGPEASITGLAVGTISGIAMLWYVRRKSTATAKVAKTEPV